MIPSPFVGGTRFGRNGSSDSKDVGSVVHDMYASLNRFYELSACFECSGNRLGNSCGHSYMVNPTMAIVSNKTGW